MRDLFENQPEACFVNHDKGLSYFSDLSVDIFRKIVAIQFNQSLNKCYFKLNATDILVRLEGKVVLDGAVPVKQITQDKSIYKDQVLGPLAVLLHREVGTLKSTFGGFDNAEVLDLMSKALLMPWWNSLEEILGHPLFWTLDKKMVSLVLIKIWMTTNKTKYPHGVPGVIARTRSISELNFTTAYANNIFYNIQYTISEKDGEYQVQECKVNWDWRVFFNGGPNLAFSRSFYLGSSRFGTRTYFCENLYTVRNVTVHWGSASYDALAVNFDLKTSKDSFILLDANFRFSLSIFYTLKQLNVILWEIT